MKILYELQLSSINKETGKVMIDSDSNYNFAINLLKELKNYADITVMVPLLKQMENAEESLAALTHMGLKYIEMPFVPHFAESRFFAPLEIYRSLIKAVNPDVIFCNDPTHVANWKQLDEAAKIVTYNHWICFFNAPKNRVPFYFRQIEGEYLADLVFCNSLTQRNALIRQTRYLPKVDYSRFKVLAPSVDESIICSRSDDSEKNLILFNHRLSSQEEYATNTKNFMSIIDDVKKECPDVKVLFTNPSGYKMSDKDYFAFKTLKRDKYIKLLAQAPITCAFFDHERMWSMSLEEANAFGSISVVPSHSAFLEMYPKMYKWFYGGLPDAREKLIFLLKNYDERIEEGKILKQFVLKNFSNVIQAKKAYELIENMTK